MWISMSLAWTPARSRSRSPHIALKVFCWSLLVAIVLIVLLLVLSARLPSRPSSCRPVSLLACRFAPRSVFRVSPFFVSGGGALGGTDVKLIGKSSRGSSVWRLLTWSVRVYSLVVVVSLIFSIVSVSESDFRCREGGFRASSAACLGNRSRFILCVSVRSCSFLPACRLVAAVRLSVRFSSRSSRRGGGAAAGVVACLPVSLRLLGGRCCPISSRLASRLFATGSGEAWALSVLSCLLGVGDGADVRRPVPVPVARAITCPLTVGAWRLDEMR